ncbi:MAG: IS1595 family transposase [Methyloceanibacter sp.]
MAKADIQNAVFNDETAAREALEAVRWPQGPVCPHCGNLDQEKIKKGAGKVARPGLYYCAACNGQFTVTVGTVMERSKIPLTKWLMAMHLMGSSKKGISAHQLHRLLGVTYKSAWFMAHRIREAMRDAKPTTMGGQGQAVQADETYYGNTSKRAKGYRKGLRHKTQVIALVDHQSGRVRTFTGKSATAKEVRELLLANVDPASTLVTDESNLYGGVGREFGRHARVRHAKGKYVTKDGLSTNNVENFFGVFKKGIVGIYHFCSEQHLQRYLDEFQFRYNNRSGLGVSDGERAARIAKGIEGKRLTYRPIDGNHASSAVR